MHLKHTGAGDPSGQEVQSHRITLNRALELKRISSSGRPQVAHAAVRAAVNSFFASPGTPQYFES